MSTLRTYCVTHEAPLVPDALADYVIGIGDYHPTRGKHISVLDRFWHEMRPYAYGAAGNYVIPRAMDATGPTAYTGVFSHRKIIVRNQVGKQSPEYFVYWEVDTIEAAEIPREEIMPRPGFDFLIGFPFKMPAGIVSQYIERHVAIDFFQYVSLALEMGILTPEQCQAFALETDFIPGGCELGIYPTVWVRSTLLDLERLGREFLIRYGGRIKNYDNYQVRAVGFLAERLGSFLLLREMIKRYPAGLPRGLFGHLCALVPPGGGYEGAKV